MTGKQVAGQASLVQIVQGLVTQVTHSQKILHEVNCSKLALTATEHLAVAYSVQHDCCGHMLPPCKTGHLQ